MAELDAYARLFGLDAKVFVSKPAPDANQLALAAMMDDVVLLIEDPNTEYGTAVVDERTIDLHQRVKGQARQDPMAQRVQSIWYELECVPIEPDPFARLSNLYAIHEKDKTLAADCAMAEGLGKEPLPALKQAYAHNNERAVITQSALACKPSTGHSPSSPCASVHVSSPTARQSPRSSSARDESCPSSSPPRTSATVTCWVGSLSVSCMVGEVCGCVGAYRLL